MSHYLLEPDRRIPGIAAVGTVPDDMDPLDWMHGKRMPPPAAGPMRLPLSDSSGDLRPEIMGTLLTLFSDTLKDAMGAFGIDNIDYHPVELQHPVTKVVEQGYWLANIIGIVSCVDTTRSVIVPRPSGGKGWLKSFYVDPARASALRIFRLAEDPTLIVIDEPLRSHLRSLELAGVRLRHTKAYDGY